MPGKYSLRYLPVAEEDLISILDWIAKDSPARALKFVEKLEEKIGKLEQFPLMGRVPRHYKLREYGYSVLISKGKFPAACGEVVIFVSVKKSIHT
jgi:toxin ParE1/3/4